MSSELLIRPAREDDLPALGKLGAGLLRTHYAFDPQRFMGPGDAPEDGYGWFLGTKLHESDAVVLVAERAGSAIGYVYAGIEPQSWKELREVAGFIHDVAVDEQARGSGAGRALVDAAIVWLRQQGAPRVILWTAERNDLAQRLFAQLGFRRTMVEMTREL